MKTLGLYEEVYVLLRDLTSEEYKQGKVKRVLFSWYRYANKERVIQELSDSDIEDNLKIEIESEIASLEWGEWWQNEIQISRILESHECLMALGPEIKCASTCWHNVLRASDSEGTVCIAKKISVPETNYGFKTGNYVIARGWQRDGSHSLFAHKEQYFYLKA